MTGFNWDAVLKLESMLENMSKPCNSNIIQAIVIFLFKLRSGNSDILIAVVLDVTEEIFRDSKSVLKCFCKHVVSKHFGPLVYSREYLL